MWWRTGIHTCAATLLLAWRVVARAPSIAVVSPENHSVWPVDLAAGELREFALELSIDGFHVPDDGVVRVTGEKIGEHTDGFVITTQSRFVVISGIEPGSNFWRFALVHTNGSTVGHTTFHIDVVVPQHTTLPQWRYQLGARERRRRVLFNLPQPSARGVNHTSGVARPSRNRICFVGSTSGLFDGQKKIWLQAIAALPRSQWDIQALTFEEVVSSAFTQALLELNISVRGIPLNVTRADLAAHEIDPSEVMSRLVESFDSEFSDTNDVSIDEFRRRVDRLQPPFVAKPWQLVVETLHESCAGAVLAFASSTDAPGRMLVKGARAAGVRAVVMELANLRPVSVQVDALVGPSHYALNHPSITNSVSARQRYVLSTGINTELFHPASGHGASTERGSKLFTIGYIGRLATEKTLGLFLRAARLIALSCRAKCRFRLIGDGPQREALENLAQDWGIADFIEFPGGIYEEDTLVQAVQQLDVVVSLCFHETLGIAPLEAMSCGVPVVGFASGGVGEFLEHGVNGLVIDSPTAEAVRDAIMTLVRDESLRQRLGRNARTTVVQRFSYAFGAEQYVALYERLARH